MIAIEITLSKWLYNAVLGMEVLTLDRDYFRLRKALDRRLYEIARKHCGPQTRWKVGLALLHKKAGSTAPLKKFRYNIRGLARTNHLPGYYVAYDEDADQVSFWTRDNAKLTEAIRTGQGREVFKAIPSA